MYYNGNLELELLYFGGSSVQPFLNSDQVPAKVFHWAWMALSLVLLAAAGVVLYPVVQNMMTESRPAAPAPGIEIPAPAPSRTRPDVARVKKETPAPVRFRPLVVHQVSPVIPESIKNRIDRDIPVAIRIHVSGTGKVVKAEPLIREDGLSAYLASRAVEAVRRWQFEPVVVQGRPVSGQMTIHFRFKKFGIEWN